MQHFYVLACFVFFSWAGTVDRGLVVINYMVMKLDACESLPLPSIVVFRQPHEVEVCRNEPLPHVINLNKLIKA